MSLEGKQIRNTYRGLAIFNDTNSELTTSLQSVKDGAGNESPLKIGTNRVGISDYVFPQTDGTANQVLATDGSGQLTWANTSVIDWANFNQSIIPDTAELYDLGSSARPWRHVHVGPGSLYVNGNRVITDDSGTIVVSTDNNQNLSIKTTGTGNLELAAEGTGNLTFKSNINIQSGSSFYSTGSEISFGDDINMNSRTIKGLAAPVNPNDAARKADVDAIALAYTPLNKAGDTMTGELAMSNNRITGLAEPVAGTDAATKNYVDTTVAGFAWKNSVKAATTTNITMMSNSIIDGVSVVSGDRVLVKDQVNKTQNGIYVVQGSVGWVRATDADNTPGAEIGGGTAVFVEAGNLNGGTAWVVTAPAGEANLGTSEITFTQFAGGGTYLAGDGLGISGNEFAVDNSVVRTAGNQSIAGTKTFTSNIIGNLAGNAATATALAASRTFSITGQIGATGVAFDGTGNVTLNIDSLNASNLNVGTVPPARLSGSYDISVSGNAATATKLQTPRNISLTGAATGTATAFDGSVAISIPVTDLNASNLSSGTIPDARISDNIVKTTGNQTINGVKVFTNNTIVNNTMILQSRFAPLKMIATSADPEHSTVILSLSDNDASFNISFRNTDGDIISDTPYKIARSSAHAILHQFRINNALAAQIVSAGTSMISNQDIVTREKGDARYAQLGVSNYFAGSQVIQNTAPALYFVENDQTGHGAAHNFVQSNKLLYMQRRDETIASSGTTNIAVFENTGSTLSQTFSVVTREKGDARYIRSGIENTFTGSQYINNGGIVINHTFPYISLIDTNIGVSGHGQMFYDNGSFVLRRLNNESDETQSQIDFTSNNIIQMWTKDGSNPIALAAVIDHPGPTMSYGQSVVTREKGDARYALLGSSNLFTDIGNQGDPTIAFSRKTGGAMGFYSVSGATAVDDILRLTIDGSRSADFEKAGTSMKSIYTVVTQEKGDARYLQLTGGSMNGGIIFNNTLATTRDDLSKHINLWGSNYGFSMTSGSLNIVYAVNGKPYFVQSDGTIDAMVDPKGTSLSNTESIVTREKGDARYVTRTDGRVSSKLAFGSVDPTNWDGIYFIDSNDWTEGFYLLADGSDPTSGQPNYTNLTNLWAGNIRFTGSLYCTSNNTSDLGSSTYRMRTLYSVNALNTSDINTKENINSLDLGLDFINNLNPVSFEFKDVPGVKRNGFIAQEVKEQISESDNGIWVEETTESGDKVQLLSYQDFIAPLTKAVQELSKKVDELTTELNMLKGNN